MLKEINDTPLSDRTRILIDDLLLTVVENHETNLLSIETISKFIIRKYTQYSYSVLKSIAEERKVPISDLHSVMNDSRNLVMQRSVLFFRKCLGALYVFCLEDVRDRISFEDPVKSLEAICKINFAEVLSTMDLEGVPETILSAYNPIDRTLQFDLISLENTYSDMHAKYEKEACHSCKKEAEDKLLCLYCGAVVCTNLAEDIIRNSSMCFIEHSRKCQGTSGIYISIGNGQILCQYKGLCAVLNSPYSATSDKTSKLVLSKEAVDELRDYVVSDKIPGIVLQRVKEKYPKCNPLLLLANANP
eukprot:TRINITY_DN11991_c0_g1_i4.p1 TRINITY_DN11991_c0_g1~~TRINITY_DN11991_c0_g1_i4.p1  ORF type:complete len:303 (+),score=31.36 TRINITY_DN11991_c0_g1_i4:123-1031(+)